MRKLNQELIDKLRKGELAIYYGAKARYGNFDDLDLVLREAFKSYSGTLGGNSQYYKKMDGCNDWTGIDSVPVIPVANLAEFFITEPETVSNYEIF